MKLSEAIIKGCEGTYQIHGQNADGLGGYCVAGTAKVAVGVPRLSVGFVALTEVFPETERFAMHPVDCIRGSICRICVSLNDIYRWPRLSIAEWLANVVEPEFEKCAKQP